MSHPRARRNLRAASEPIPVGKESDSAPTIVDPEIAVIVPRHHPGHHRLHFLRDDADIALVATEETEAVIAEAVVQMPEQGNIMFERNIRPPTAASATTSTAATACKSTSATATAAGKPAASALEASATRSRNARAGKTLSATCGLKIGRTP
jgi:hypothetical protein